MKKELPPDKVFISKEKYSSILQKILDESTNLLHNFEDEIPTEIISGGTIATENGYKVVGKKSLIYKCQRNWLDLVVKIADMVEILLPLSRDEETPLLATNYTEFITSRSNIKIEDDPQTKVDKDGGLHRLTTKEEIDASNEFLTHVIAKLEAILEEQKKQK